MTANEIFTLIAVGTVITIVMFVLGFTLNKKWLKVIAIIPFMLSLLPLLYLYLLFGLH